MPYFDFVVDGASVFHKHMSSLFSRKGPSTTVFSPISRYTKCTWRISARKKCARLSKVFCRWWTPTFSESGSVKREYWISDKIDRAITMSRKIIRAYREVVYANTVRGLSLSSPKHNRRVLLLFICNDRYTVRGEKKHIHACMSILKQIYRHSFQFQANHWNLTMPNR